MKPFVNLSFCCATCAAISLQAQKLDVRTDKNIYRTGEPITFTFRLTSNDNKPIAGSPLNCTILHDGHPNRVQKVISGAPSAKLTLKQDIPGSLLIVTGYDVTLPNGKKVRRWNARGAIIAPEKIKAGLPEPADFDAFWKARKAEVAKVPMKAELKAVDLKTIEKGRKKFYADKGVAAYSIKITCAGGKPVTGYLAKPVKAAKRSLPAIVTFQHAGTYSASVPARYGTRAIALDVNAHGIKNGEPASYYNDLAKKELRLYYHSGNTSRDTFYYKGMYMRVIRALEYVKSLPEWDGKNLIVSGFSQGGAQALAAAGLDPQVSLCVAICPALCDLGGGLAKRRSGWGTNARFKNGKPVAARDQKILTATSYYDNVNFARRIKGEVYISTGINDQTCAASSAYAAWNDLPKGLKKTFFLNTQGGHVLYNPAADKRINQIIFSKK